MVLFSCGFVLISFAKRPQYGAVLVGFPWMCGINESFSLHLFICLFAMEVGGVMLRHCRSLSLETHLEIPREFLIFAKEFGLDLFDCSLAYECK